MHPLLQKLEGGDLRSIGRSNEVAHEVIANTSLVGELVAALSLPNAVVRMRSADALEKVARSVPHVVQSHSAELLRLLGQPQPKEVLWHLLQIAPRLEWKQEELPVVFEAATRALSEPSSIVRTCAIQALADLLPQCPGRSQEVTRHLEFLAQDGTSAMRVRARKLLQSLLG